MPLSFSVLATSPTCEGVDVRILPQIGRIARLAADLVIIQVDQGSADQEFALRFHVGLPPNDPNDGSRSQSTPMILRNVFETHSRTSLSS
jgi:hypothetical protein